MKLNVKMLPYVISAGAIAAAVAANAQVPDALLEACNAVPEPAKRLECLKQATARSTPAIAASDESIRRSLIGLQGSLNTGISLVNYRAAVNDIARELAVFERDASPQAASGIAKLKEALDTYADAGRFWDAAISFYARSNNSISYFGGLPMQQVGLEWMVAKHGLPTRNADLLGMFAGVPTDAGRNVMWVKANTLADEDLGLVRNPQAAIAAKSLAKAAAGPPQATALGITAEPTPASGLRILKVDEGAAEGLQIDDHIFSIDGTRMFTLGDLHEAIAKVSTAGRTASVFVMRGGAPSPP